MRYDTSECPTCLGSGVVDAASVWASQRASSRSWRGPQKDAAAVAAVRAACTTGQARRIRKGANLSLQMVARAVGVSHSTVMRWEGAKNLPTGVQAVAYARLLARLNGGALDDHPKGA